MLYLAFLSFICLSLAGDIGPLIVLNGALKDGAACLDGSPPAYYLATGSGTGANKWYIHHEGGGWCYDMAECYSRSKTNLGSSTVLSKSINTSKMGGYFSPDPKVNSLMYNWNKVFLAYCDGASFSGNNDTVTNYQGHQLHFKGFRNLKAYKQDLDFNRNFRQATDVVISGCSAGGLATYLHLDWWREHIIHRTKVIGLPDSGFFLDYESTPKYASKMRWVFQQQNSTAGLNQRCISANKNAPEKCIFAEHTAPHISTPYFPMQSEYDSWQLINVLGSQDTNRVNEFGKLLTQRFRSTVIQGKSNGAFLDSCKHHCGAWNDIVINSKDINQAFERFYRNPTSGQAYIQGKTFPCDACCHRGQ